MDKNIGLTMSEFSNKNVMDKLTAYFMTQEKDLVARSCASLTVDLNRFYCMVGLSKAERENLIERTEITLMSVKKFLETGVSSDIKIYNMEIEDKNEA